MQPAPLAPHLRAFAPDFARRFTRITADLAALIARLFLRNPSLAPLIIPLYTRLTRAGRRCTGLMAFLAKHGSPRRAARRGGQASGIAAPISPSDQGRPTQRPTQRPGQHPLTPAPRMPTTQAWLIKILLQEGGPYRSQLAHLLAQPGAAELLAASPTTARLLRPICRMLGLSLPAAAAIPPQPPPAHPPAPPVVAPKPPPATRPVTRHIPPPPRPLADDLPWVTSLPRKKPA